MKTRLAITAILALAMIAAFFVDVPTTAQAQTPGLPRGPWVDRLIWSEQENSGLALQEIKGGDADFFMFSLQGGAEKTESFLSPTVLSFSTYGSVNALLFNPNRQVGDGLPGQQAMNPFTDAQIREAMQWLIDRNFLNLEALDGFAVSFVVPFHPRQPEYFRELELFQTLENQYQGDFARAQGIINTRMAALGATRLAGTCSATNTQFCWRDAFGDLIDIQISARIEDERLQIGQYVGSQLTRVGFKTTVNPTPGSQAIALVYGGDPSIGAWHIYTEGWAFTAHVAWDDAQIFNFHLCGIGEPFCIDPLSGQPNHPAATYSIAQDFSDDAQTLGFGLYQSSAQRQQLIRDLTPRTLTETNYRMWIQAEQAVFPVSQRIDGVAFDASGGPWTHFTLKSAKLLVGEPGVSRTTGVGGDLRVLNFLMFADAWNPWRGNWLYDSIQRQAFGDPGMWLNPNTGEWIDYRVTTSVETAGPLGTMPVPVTALAWNFASTTLTAAHAAGSTTLTVASIVDFAVGDIINVGSGATQEQHTIAAIPSATSITIAAPLANAQPNLARVADAQGKFVTLDSRVASTTLSSAHAAGPSSRTSTALTLAHAAGSTTLTVDSSAGFAAGQDIAVGSGTTQELKTIASVPSATTIVITTGLANAQPSGARVATAFVLRVASTAGYFVGQNINVGSGAPQELHTIEKIWDATTITITKGLANAQPSGAPVVTTFRAVSKVTTQLTDPGKWHTGQNITMDDLIYGLGTSFRRAFGDIGKHDSRAANSIAGLRFNLGTARYPDPAPVGAGVFKGFEFNLVDNNVTAYLDFWHLDPQEIRAAGHIYMSAGEVPAPWEIQEGIIRTVLEDKTAIHEITAGAKGVPRLDLGRDPLSISLIDAAFAANQQANFVPPFMRGVPGLGAVITSAEATARYQASQAFRTTYGHWYASNGPFILESINPSFRQTVMIAFRDGYPFTPDHWDFLKIKRVPTATFGSFQASLLAGTAATLSVTTREAGNLTDAKAVRWFVRQLATGGIPIRGDAVRTGLGAYEIQLLSTLTVGLATGGYELVVVVQGEQGSLTQTIAFSVTSQLDFFSALFAEVEDRLDTQGQQLVDLSDSVDVVQSSANGLQTLMTAVLALAVIAIVVPAAMLMVILRRLPTKMPAMKEEPPEL